MLEILTDEFKETAKKFLDLLNRRNSLVKQYYELKEEIKANPIPCDHRLLVLKIMANDCNQIDKEINPLYQKLIATGLFDIPEEDEG